MNELKLTLFDTGYCHSFEKIVAANKLWKVTQFHALVGLIEHPNFGPILFDTGYSPHIHEACRHFPFNMYRRATPIHYGLSAAQCVLKHGYRPEEIQHVVISHFHADHIGGLKDFPNATFHYLAEAYKAVASLKGLKAVFNGFIPRLIPEDFVKRSKVVKEAISLPYEPFKQGYDLFGDQSILGVALPGHAHGQMGLIINTSTGLKFLVADACWQSSNYRNLEYPHRLGRIAIADYEGFCKTLHALQTFSHHFPAIKIIPTHCQEVWKEFCTC